MTTRTVVPTFAVPAMENQRSGGVRPSSCESRVKSVYEECLSYELGQAGIPHECRALLPVVYKDIRLESGFRADILVAGRRGHC